MPPERNGVLEVIVAETGAWSLALRSVVHAIWECSTLVCQRTLVTYTLPTVLPMMH
jgi:hypothetical protein